MAVALIEGFDHYASAVTGEGSISAAWTFSTTSGLTLPAGILDGTGRAMNYCTSSSLNAATRRTIGGSSDTITLCFRFKAPSSFASTTGLCLVANGSGDQGWLEVTTSGTLRYKRGTSYNPSSGTGIGTPSSNSLATGGTYFIELKVKVHASTGTVDVWVDGTNWISLTGQNTLAQAAATITRIGLCATQQNSVTWSFDDLYVLGDSADSRLGDRRVISLLPNADTAEADWALSTGATGFSLIDDDQANTTDYIEAVNNGDYSLFDIVNLSYTPATIAAIAIEICAKKTDAGTIEVRTKQKSGSTTTDGANVSLGSTFVHIQEIFVENADTTAPWTASDINSLQVGVERTT